jgi:putative transposase
MLTGIKTHFYPDHDMANALAQWIGCARVIYNAKCEEDSYLRKFSAKYLPVGTYAPADKSYSQYKTLELTPWLSQCPSQILRNSATIWHRTYNRFLDGLGGRPKRKNRVSGNYIWLTQELFSIKWEGSTCVLTIGTKRNNVGTVRVKWNKSRIPKSQPKSIWIKKTAHRWHIAFSYDDGHVVNEFDTKDHLKHLKKFSEAELVEMITPVDRGVAKPLHTHNAIYSMWDYEKKKLDDRHKKLKRYQRRMARQKKGSNRRHRTVAKISRIHEKIANTRSDFWHQATHSLVANSKVIVIEDLKLNNMTRRAAPKLNATSGRWEKNGAKAKSGLNKAILNAGLGTFEVLLNYKMKRACKPLFKVSAHHTSQECANCGYTHPGNRKTQSDFKCLNCNHKGNADQNAALVIRKRAIEFIKHSGTELTGTDKNVLRLRAGANSRKTGDC